ncbi:sec-independent protein translocase protein TatC [Desulfosalsimonas propionicica]|uniref:Sec-independent protein translocase protein TatC n=1 Tax=Desulfosalsimonas propionicica TaxID=332175 RepID=A0A7W0HJ58_9BACT|nr:twin-arginine translocase subunit TatC [Desulfosalsimonas propionicica]MBA2879741.1 sec-independent protein translocase protein TatC [Desulfosalsimonas propionicica]
MDEEEKLPLTEHLEELRDRLIRCFIAIFAGFVIAYVFKERLFQILTRPLIRVMEQGDTLIFTGIPEAFFTYLKVSLLAGLMLAAPVVIYQFWMFLAPGLYKEERRLMIPIVFVSAFFFIGGALFGYFLVFPFGFKFLLGFASETIRPLPSMREYLSFSAKLLLAFGFVFELPIVITFMARLGLVNVPFLKKNRKYALLIFFAGSALLTPPDVVTQIMLAAPMMVLYEISIMGARVFGRSRQAEDPEEQKDKHKTGGNKDA